MKKFIHVDMDAFYVSVEIRDNPALRGQPVAVGGKSRHRGVLSTCNYIARQYGIHSAMPTAHAIKKCPSLVVVPGRMSVYKEVSEHIRRIFKRYTHLVEPLSLDEAYLDVSDAAQCKGSATLIAQQIRKEVYDETQLTASAGIAPLKFVAKIASDMNKPNGQYLVTPDDMEQFLMALPLQKIPGVGKVSFEKLSKLGLTHGHHIRSMPECELADKFGKFGVSLWRKCNGIDNRDVQVSRVRKSVGVERTFSDNYHSEEELYKYLKATLIPELNIRASKYILASQIEKIGVKLKFADFTQTTKEQKHTEIDENLLKELLHEAFLRGNGKSVRLLGIQVGISASNAVDGKQLSLSLVDATAQ